MTDRDLLDALYRRTRYVALLDAAPLDLWIGRADPAADERLRREAGCLRAWALVTPCNPRSRSLSDADNAARHDAMHAELVAMGQRFVPAVGRDPDGRWPDEPGFLLVDPPERLAVELAERWDQNAIVTGRPGEAPTLLWVVQRGDPMG